MGMTAIRFLALEIWQKEFKIMNRMSVSCFFYHFSPINDQSKRGLQPQQWLNGICIYLLWPGSVVTIVFFLFFFGVQYHCRLHCDLNPKCFLQLTGPWLNYLDNSLCVTVQTSTSKYKEWERHRHRQRERQKQSVGLFSTTDSSTVSNWRLWNGCVCVLLFQNDQKQRSPVK